ncbi:MAG: high frequency lysogenization protein HflD [Cellvibrionaceae bacterium]
MSKNWNDITLALAGVFQAAALVEQLAKTGYIPSDAQTVSINSLLEQNPESTLAVYGGKVDGVELGLKVMSDLLHHHQNRDYPDTLRYVLGILHLQKKMMARKDMLESIGSGLEQSARQAEHFGTTHENVLASIGSLYSDTISTFKFRIQVNGDFSYLQQTRVANQVRALLFSGIRSATLWRQVGGKRLQVILSRKRLSATADELLKLQKS